MTSIPRLGKILRRVLCEDATQLANDLGVIQRSRVFTAASLLQMLVFGWLQNPQAGSSALARFAGGLGLKVSKQGIEERFTPVTASWLLAVLQRGVQSLVCAQAVSQPVLARFAGVYLEDGSTITLPAVLAQVWKGCGGSGAAAAVKITVRWDLLRGGLCGPYLQAGRQHETQSPLREQKMARGSLWIADLGYFGLIWLGELVRQGVYFLISYKEGVVICTPEGQRREILELLPSRQQGCMEMAVRLGSRRPVQARLMASKMSPEVIARRRKQLKEEAHKQGKTITAHQWEMVQWSIVLTNVPACKLSGAEAMAGVWARWQIELLWKLWKDEGRIDEWQSEKPDRILCELYAKLLGMLVQHWVLLLACWDDPHRSLVGACRVIREQVPMLIHGLTGRLPLCKVLALITQAVAGGCSIPYRQDRLSTSHRLLLVADPGFT
jgi:hypothetical protein